MDTPISREKLQRKKLLQIALSAAIALGVAAAAWAVNRAIAPVLDPNSVMLAEVRRGSINDSIFTSGLAVPLNEQQMSSPGQTRVVAVHVKPGQQVNTGELLLELDAQSIRLALESLEEQIAQQQNKIVGFEHDMQQKQKQYERAIELYQIDLQSATAKLERSNLLRASGIVSGEDLLAAQLNVKRIEIQLRQQRDLIGDNRRTALNNIEAANLQKEILRKQVQQQEVLLAQTRVLAPFNGVVSSLVTESGSSVVAGQTVAKVSSLKDFRIESTVSEFYAGSINIGQEALVSYGKYTLKGKVSTILPDAQTGTIKLYIALDQPNHAILRNKLRMDVSIIKGRRDNVLVAENGPAFNGKGRQMAFVVRDGVAKRVAIEVGDTSQTLVELRSGVRPGEKIIVSDIGNIKEYDQVRLSR